MHTDTMHADTTHADTMHADSLHADIAHGSPELVVKGTLDPEETAALAAVLQAVATQTEQGRDVRIIRTDGDRTSDRRRRLGLGARPGSDSWRHAAGRR